MGDNTEYKMVIKIYTKKHTVAVVLEEIVDVKEWVESNIVTILGKKMLKLENNYYQEDYLLCESIVRYTVAKPVSSNKIIKY